MFRWESSAADRCVHSVSRAGAKLFLVVGRRRQLLTTSKHCYLPHQGNGRKLAGLGPRAADKLGCSRYVTLR